MKIGRLRTLWPAFAQQHGPACPQFERCFRDRIGLILRINDRQPRIAHEFAVVGQHHLARAFPMPRFDKRLIATSDPRASRSASRCRNRASAFFPLPLSSFALLPVSRHPPRSRRSNPETSHSNDPKYQQQQDCSRDRPRRPLAAAFGVVQLLAHSFRLAIEVSRIENLGSPRLCRGF